MGRADDHRYFEGMAVAHVLGGLDDGEGRVFRAHLLECADCRARVGELRAIAHDLADVERDERRVRAAQALETKRRESDDDEEAPEQEPESSRASRVTVLVGLVLLIGLSLWNFTLRGALTQQHQINAKLRDAGVIAKSGSGTRWSTVISQGDVEGSVISDGGEFVASVDGLDDTQVYGLFVVRGDGETQFSSSFAPPDGRLYQLFRLPEGADKVIISDPADPPGGEVGQPGSTPSGTTVFEARRP